MNFPLLLYYIKTLDDHPTVQNLTKILFYVIS